MEAQKKRRIILIHGYSDCGPSFKTWIQILGKHGFDAQSINVCDYRTLTNEVTIKDIAEGFDRALRHAGLHEEEFDAIVHSTGMLVLRSWLSTYTAKRIGQLKHLIGLAPASFGSPLAYKGRSWIGAIFKGNRELGPDFMEAGDKVLDGLELGSSFTWDLAHKDLLDKKKIFYSPDPATPYVFTFIGNKGYGKLHDMMTKAPGTDGTVRWAGCALNIRKIKVDFTKPKGDAERFKMTDWDPKDRCNLGLPFVPIKDVNHATILSEPTQELIDLVVKALRVDSSEALQEWCQTAKAATAATYDSMVKYQQFVVHCRDERNDPITDFHIQLYRKRAGKKKPELIDMHMHPYSADNSYRCFHVNLDALKLDELDDLQMDLIASSGSELVQYSEHIEQGLSPSHNISLSLTPYIKDKNLKFFYPFTTTLIELKLNREPMPMWEENRIVRFIKV